MILLIPTDTELDWNQVQAGMEDDALAAELIWREAGILMPDDAADDFKVDAMESLLTATAIALGIPLTEVFPARHRIRWMTWTDGAGEWPVFASLDGGPPTKISPTTKPT